MHVTARLKFEGLQGNVLGGDEEFTGEGGFGGPAMQGFPGADFGGVDVVVFVGEVGEDQIARMMIKPVRIGKKFADGVIREVPVARHDPLLDDPRVGTHFQHIEVVIGLEDQKV